MLDAILRLVHRWIRGLKVGFIGLFLWLRGEWPLFALWLLILLVAFLRGCSLFHMWVLLILGTCLIVAEMLNTAIERLCDFVNPNFSKEIKAIKDICTGAVLVSGLALVVVAVWIIAGLGSWIIRF